MTVEENDNPTSSSAPAGLVALAPGVSAPKAALHYSFARSGGPGGQNVNKVNTKAELRLYVTALIGLDEAGLDRLRRLAGSRLTKEDEILITADDTRSQVTNRRACLERLRALVAEAAKKPRRRRKKRISRAQKEKRLQSKRERSEKKSRRQWKPGE